MKWYPKSIRETMYPISVLNWLTGLGLVDYPVGNSRHNLFFIVIAIIVSFFWITTIKYEKQSIASNNDNLAEKLYRMIQYLSVLSATTAIIIGWYYRKKMQLFTENIEIMDEAFERLGLKKNYYRSFKKILCIVLVYFILMCNVYIVRVYLQMKTESNLMMVIMYANIRYWPTYTNIVVDINFTISLNCIETRFENINILLQKNCCARSKTSLFEKYQIYSATTVSKLSTNPDQLNFEKNKHLVELMKQIHLELCKLSREVNQIYGVHLTIQMTLNFLYLTVCLFNLGKLYFATATKLKYKMMLNITGWTVIFLLKFLHVNIACCRVSNQVKKTEEILLDMKQRKKNFKMIREIDQFYRQISQQHLTFTTCGFNTLGLSFIFSFLGTVITYLLILIQMAKDANKVKED